MSTGAIIGIVIVVIVVAAAAVAASELQRARMRRQFGPEYDRLAKELGRKKADAELTARQRRVAALGIHPLTPGQAAPVTYFHKVASAAHRDEPDLLAPAGRRDDVAAVASPDGMTADEEEGEQTSSSRWPARLQEAIQERQRGLRGRWDGGVPADTETLRETLRLYRALLYQLIGSADAPAR